MGAVAVLIVEDVLVLVEEYVLIGVGLVVLVEMSCRSPRRCTTIAPSSRWMAYQPPPLCSTTCPNIPFPFSSPSTRTVAPTAMVFR